MSPTRNVLAWGLLLLLILALFVNQSVMYFRLLSVPEISNLDTVHDQLKAYDQNDEKRMVDLEQKIEECMRRTGGDND